MIRWRRQGAARHPVRTWLIRLGVSIASIAGAYLLAGMVGLTPLEPGALAWNNIRVISGAAVLGCLLAAIGYGNE